MLLSSGMSSKIFREARIQQKENEIEAKNQLRANSFFELPEQIPNDDEDDEIDAFNGFSETQSHIGTFEEVPSPSNNFSYEFFNEIKDILCFTCRIIYGV